MLYIKQDNGDILDISFTPQDGYQLSSLEDPYLKHFLTHTEAGQAMSNRMLNDMDLDMARVVEDLIYLLVDKQAIRFTDLPEIAQNKLLFKRGLRSSLNNETFLSDDDEIII